MRALRPVVAPGSCGFGLLSQLPGFPGTAAAAATTAKSSSTSPRTVKGTGRPAVKDELKGARRERCGRPSSLKGGRGPIERHGRPLPAHAPSGQYFSGLAWRVALFGDRRGRAVDKSSSRRPARSSARAAEGGHDQSARGDITEVLWAWAVGSGLGLWAVGFRPGRGSWTCVGRGGPWGPWVIRLTVGHGCGAWAREAWTPRRYRAEALPDCGNPCAAAPPAPPAPPCRLLRPDNTAQSEAGAQLSHHDMLVCGPVRISMSGYSDTTGRNADTHEPQGA